MSNFLKNVAKRAGQLYYGKVGNVQTSVTENRINDFANYLKNDETKSGHIAERQVDKEYVKKESRIREPQPRVDIKQHSKNPDKETVVETDVPLDEEEFEKPKDDGTKDPKFRKSEKKNKQNLQEEQTTAKVPFMVV